MVYQRVRLASRNKAWVAMATHDVLFPGFGRQSQSGNAVGHQIDPKHMDRLERDGQPEEGCQENGKNLARIAGHGVLDELADVVEDATTFADGFDNGGKVVVQQDHVGSFLGHIGAGNAHGHVDIRSFQSRRIVDSVAGHCHKMPPVLQGLDDLELLLGGHPGIDPDLFDSLLEFFPRKLREFPPGDDNLPFAADDPNPPGNDLCRQRMVSRDHHRPDSRGPTHGHRFEGLSPGRVHHADDAEQDQQGISATLGHFSSSLS